MRRLSFHNTGPAQQATSTAAASPVPARTALAYVLE